MEVFVARGRFVNWFGENREVLKPFLW